jgi:ethanolamine ammonia-lyase large subunit
MATELLTAAGANYYMDVCLNTDRMLAYFDTSGHDVQTLREIHGKEPAAEYLAWAIEQGVFARDGGGAVVRGPRFGDVRRFCDGDEELAELVRATPAAFGFATAGPRPAGEVSRRARMHQAIAREAILSELRVEELLAIAPFRVIETGAKAKEAQLGSPDLGAQLAEGSAARLSAERNEVQVVVSDGLSAEAVHANLPDLFPVLADGLAARGLSVGQPILARYGRVKLAEPIADRLLAKLVVMLIGERPGGGELASRSLSAYLAYRLEPGATQEEAAAWSGNSDVRFEYTVISNIYAGGLPPVEAASVIIEKAAQILEHRAAGNRLESRLSRGQAEARAG